ncbi:serine hydrolase domain-containing protein [Haloplasma contractile]|uniref:Beta-lactamase protein n=1 Tax=Haloplasma contractile SSD-17B TaxID=1033810 RepID=U2FEN0_9MOLU|nr:serine hydrolase domain-containing protein [Haloplasma contractile]ERJ11405.1 beta-lactamase protein [Haloplasma contractile SSD-17B]
MELLTNFKHSVIEKNLGVYGIHVYQNGKTLAEYRFRSNDRENLYSASKTFASVEIGIAENEGRFQLSDQVLNFFPEYKTIAYPGSEKITIKNLLQMSSGHSSEDFSQYNKKDRAELFFISEMKAEPGSNFYYEDLCSYMLGRIVEKVTGKTMLEYLKPRLFEPLEIINPQWHTCQNGHTSCSGGLYLTTEEFSRIGITLLQNGVYKDIQIVPDDYVNRLHMDFVDTSSKNDPETRGGYGYQVFKCTPPGTYRADGMYGQLCVVLKDYDAVVTVTAHNEIEHKEILRTIWSDILPILTSKS